MPIPPSRRLLVVEIRTSGGVGGGRVLRSGWSGIGVLCLIGLIGTIRGLGMILLRKIPPTLCRIPVLVGYYSRRLRFGCDDPFCKSGIVCVGIISVPNSI